MSIDQFAANAEHQLRLPEHTARTAAESLLSFLAAEAGTPSPGPKPAAPKLGGLASLSSLILERAASSLGGEGRALRLADRLRRAGLPADQLVDFVSLFCDYLDDNELADSLANLPGRSDGMRGLLFDLKSILGAPASADSTPVTDDASEVESPNEVS